jgi:hypothetical protein
MVIELGGSVFEITHDLVGDLFRAKNAGVTTNKKANIYAMIKLGLVKRKIDHPRVRVADPQQRSQKKGLVDCWGIGQKPLTLETLDLPNS